MLKNEELMIEARELLTEMLRGEVSEDGIDTIVHAHQMINRLDNVDEKLAAYVYLVIAFKNKGSMFTKLRLLDNMPEFVLEAIETLLAAQQEKTVIDKVHYIINSRNYLAKVIELSRINEIENILDFSKVAVEGELDLRKDIYLIKTMLQQTFQQAEYPGIKI